MEYSKREKKLNLKINKWLIPQLIILFIFRLDIKFIICFFFIVLHEITHLIVVKAMDIKFEGIRFHCLGATLEIKEYSNLTIREQITICLVGPIFNIIVCLISYIMLIFFRKDFFMIIAQVNLSLAIFNFIPICPLDGFKLLMSVLAQKYSYKNASKIATIVSYIFNIFLIVIAVVLLLHKCILSIFVIVICGFSIFETFKNRRKVMYIIMENLLKKQEIISKKRYIDNFSLSVSWEEYSIGLLKFLRKEKFHIFYVVDNNMKVRYILKEDEFIDILNNYGNIKLKDYYNTRNK